MPSDYTPNGGVYIIYLSTKDKPYYYIGRTKSFKERFSNHHRKLKQGRHINNHMQNVYNKHQVFVPIVITATDNVEEQTRLEQELIDKHYQEEFCLNLCKSATGGGHSKETRKKMSETRKGMKHTKKSIAKMKRQRLEMYANTVHPAKGRNWIHKGTTLKFVLDSEIQSYLDKGWTIGRGENHVGFTSKTHSKKTRKKMQDNSNKGWTWINNGEESKVVPPNELQEHLDSGWALGMGTEWVCLNKDGMNTRIPSNQVDTYLEDGWVLGRQVEIKHSEEGKRRIALGSLGTKWMKHPNHPSKRVKPNEIQEHLNNGWAFGRKKKLF